VEITPKEQNKLKRMKRTEESLRALWDNVKCTTLQIIRVPKEEEKKKGYEKKYNLSVQFSFSVLSYSLSPHGLQHARLPCPSPIPRA